MLSQVADLLLLSLFWFFGYFTVRSSQTPQPLWLRVANLGSRQIVHVETELLALRPSATVANVTLN